MKKHTILSILAGVAMVGASSIYAEDVLTINLTNGEKEHHVVHHISSGRFVDGNMILTKDDGSTHSVSLSDVQSVDCKEGLEAQVIFTPAGGKSMIYETIPTLFRAVPTETGGSTGFGFGAKSGSVPGDLITGDFGVVFNVSASMLYSSDPIDLATQKDSYSLRLMMYNKEKVAKEYSDVVSGTITTHRDAKSRVTFSIDATFADGSHLQANQSSLVLPTSINSLDGMQPDPLIENEIFWREADETLIRNTKIMKVTKSYSSYSGKTTYKAFVGDVYGEHYVSFEVKDDFINHGKIQLAEAPAGSIRVKYYMYSTMLDVYGPDPTDSYIQFKNVVDNGFGLINDPGDGTIELYFDLQNYYSNYNGLHNGDGRHLILYYEGELQ